LEEERERRGEEGRTGRSFKDNGRFKEVTLGTRILHRADQNLDLHKGAYLKNLLATFLTYIQTPTNLLSFSTSALSGSVIRAVSFPFSHFRMVGTEVIPY